MASPFFESPCSDDFAPIRAVVRASFQDNLDMSARGFINISPVTQRRIRRLIAHWDAGDYIGIGDAFEYSALNAQMQQHFLVDHVYASALSRLKDLSARYFALRYGDYFVSGPEELLQATSAPRHADVVAARPHDRWAASSLGLPRLRQDTLAFFNTREWPEIWERLKQEPAFGDPDQDFEGPEDAEASPLVYLLQVLAGLNEAYVDDIVETIRAYVRRSATGRNRFAELEAARGMFPIATAIRNDLRDLGSAPAEFMDAVPAIRNAILGIISRYFTLFIYNEETRDIEGLKWRGKSCNAATIWIGKGVCKQPVDDPLLASWGVRGRIASAG